MTIEFPQLSYGAIEFAHQLELFSKENRPYSKDIHPATKALLGYIVENCPLSPSILKGEKQIA
jgi:hypothetical protein